MAMPLTRSWGDLISYLKKEPVSRLFKPVWAETGPWIFLLHYLQEEEFFLQSPEVRTYSGERVEGPLVVGMIPDMQQAAGSCCSMRVASCGMLGQPQLEEECTNVDSFLCVLCTCAAQHA